LTGTEHRAIKYYTYNERFSRYQFKIREIPKISQKKYILFNQIKRPGNITHVSIYGQYRWHKTWSVQNILAQEKFLPF
jgi:hypothetical protein